MDAQVGAEAVGREGPVVGVDLHHPRLPLRAGRPHCEKADTVSLSDLRLALRTLRHSHVSGGRKE